MLLRLLRPRRRRLWCRSPRAVPHALAHASMPHVQPDAAAALPNHGGRKGHIASKEGAGCCFMWYGDKQGTSCRFTSQYIQAESSHWAGNQSIPELCLWLCGSWQLAEACSIPVCLWLCGSWLRHAASLPAHATAINECNQLHRPHVHTLKGQLACKPDHPTIVFRHTSLLALGLLTSL